MNLEKWIDEILDRFMRTMVLYIVPVMMYYAAWEALFQQGFVAFFWIQFITQLLHFFIIYVLVISEV